MEGDEDNNAWLQLWLQLLITKKNEKNVPRTNAEILEIVVGRRV